MGEGVGGGQVEVFGGLVQDQHGEVGEEGAGECEPLALAAGEPGAVFADLGVQAVGQRVHPLQQPGSGERGAQGGVVGGGVGEPEVLAQGAVEEVGVLGAQADVPAYGVAVQVGGRGAGEGVGGGAGGPGGVRRVEEAQQHLGQSGLPGSGGADDRDPVAGDEVQVDAVQGGRGVGCGAGVAGGQAAQPQRERSGRGGGGVFGFPYRRGGVQDVADAFGGAAGALPVLDGQGQAQDRLEGGQRDEDDGGQPDAGEPAVGHCRDAGPGGGGDGEPGDEGEQSTGQAGDGGRPGGDPGQPAVGRADGVQLGGQGAGHGQFGGAGEQIDGAGGQLTACGGQPAVVPAGERGAEGGYGHSGEQQPGREGGTGGGQQPGGERDGAGRDGAGRDGGQQPAQVVVLEGVDVGDEP